MKPLNITILKNTLDRIESYIPDSERINTSASKVSVSWHLDHSLKVINGVVKSMHNSDPILYEDNFSILGRIVFALNYIPRGKAKAPKAVIPPETILIEDIVTQLAEARLNIESIPKLDKNAFFKHPLFGNINTSRLIRFLDAHSNHHLKIVKSILK